jgi:hypothetical protein
MYTILELLKNMSHSTNDGIAGVIGIFVFFGLMVGAGIYRAYESYKHDSEH